MVDYAVRYAWCLLVLGWIALAFVHMRSMVYTMPEFLEKRFTASWIWVLSIILSAGKSVLTKSRWEFSPVELYLRLLPELHLDLGLSPTASGRVGGGDCSDGPLYDFRRSALFVNMVGFGQTTHSIFESLVGPTPALGSLEAGAD